MNAHSRTCCPESALRALRWLCIALAILVAGRVHAADGEDWPMAAHDYASTRYSPLAEITPANASQLELAWSFSTSIDKGHEAAPIVVGATMYVVVACRPA